MPKEITTKNYVDTRLADLHLFMHTHMEQSANNAAHRDREMEAQIDRRIKAVETDLIERVGALRRELAAQTSSNKEAVDKAETAVNRRLETMNEFRAALTDQSKDYVLREVAESTFTELRKQIQSNADRLNVVAGHSSGTTDFRTALIAILVLLATVAAIISPHIT